MTRLWKHSVAVLLGLVAITPTFAIEPAVRAQGAVIGRANNSGLTDRRFENPQGAAAAANPRNMLPAANGGAAAAAINQQRALAANRQFQMVNNQLQAQQAQAAARGVQPGAGQVGGIGGFVPQNFPGVGGANMNAGMPADQANNQIPGAIPPNNNAPLTNEELQQRNRALEARVQTLQQQINQQFNNQGAGGLSTNPQMISQALSSSWLGGGETDGMAGAATWEEAYLSGEGRALRGAGVYNRNTAEAMKTLEVARALAIENARTGLKTYYELKDINAAYRLKEAPEPLTKEKLDEWNRQDQPVRLTRAQYNTDTGSLRWPALLQVQAFDDERIALEDLFARRSANEFGTDSDFYRQVAGSTTALKNRLKDHLRNGERFFSDEEYMIAQNFLNSLTHEARHAPDIDGLAAN